MKCPHCHEEITLVSCDECGAEVPEEEITDCGTCGNRFCDQHADRHECEDGRQSATTSRHRRPT